MRRVSRHTRGGGDMRRGLLYFYRRLGLGHRPLPVQL